MPVAVLAKVVDLNGFSAAARALGVPKAAVSRAVADLEKSLGVKVLERTTRRISLTHAGRLLYPHAKHVVEESEAARAVIGKLHAPSSGPLRVVADPTYGRVLLTAGERNAALEQLDLAWDEYHRIGAWAWRADTQRVMREAGARRAKWSTTPQATAGWAALTPAERRVALLIGTGHTNKSASTELGVSVNTVATHLRSVFAKLNIQSRVQLANELHKADLT